MAAAMSTPASPSGHTRALPLSRVSNGTRAGSCSVHVRGSLSAYYHSSMQDIFVGSLCVTGLLLITYMAGMPPALCRRDHLGMGIWRLMVPEG